MARTLVDAATTVDVAVAEAVTDDYEVGTSPLARASVELSFAMYPDSTSGPRTPEEISALLREEWAGEGARIHYRVVERLKGSGPETFTLNGARLPPQPSPPRQHARRAHSAMDGLKFRLNSQDLSDWEGFGACINALYSDLGQRYLIFRDADGHLLRQDVAVRFQGKTIRVGGPVYSETPEPADGWLATVRAAATR